MAKNASSGGIGFVGLLTIAFIVLKLTGHITWSWVWILAPLWISTILGVVFLILIIILKAVTETPTERALRNIMRSKRGPFG